MVDDEALVLVTTAGAGQHRPQYIRDLLTCAGSPDQHRATFSYQLKWIGDGVLDEPRRLVGAKAIVVFAFLANEKDKGFRFHPIRTATIVDFVPREIVEEQLLRRDSYVGLRFELGPLVPVSPRGVEALETSCTAWVGGYLQHPRPDGPQSRFLFYLPAYDFVTEEVGEETSWIAHADALATADVLRGATVFRAQRLVTSRGKEAPFDPDRGPGTYRLTSRRRYELHVHTNTRALEQDPEYKAASADELVKATLSDSEVAIRRSQPVTFGVGRESRATIYLHAEPASATEVATLIVDGALATGLSPRVEYVIEVKPGYLSLAFGLFAVTAGIALASTSVTDWKHAAAIGAIGALLLKAFGGLLVAVGSYIAFRRIRPTHDSI